MADEWTVVPLRMIGRAFNSGVGGGGAMPGPFWPGHCAVKLTPDQDAL